MLIKKGVREILGDRFAEEYLYVYDDDLEGGFAIFRPESVKHGLRLAGNDSLASLRDVDAPTYQELRAANEQLIEKYAAEMDTLNKSQFKIRMLEEAVEEGRERHSVERCKNLKEVEKLKAYVVEIEAAQLEVAKDLNAQLDAANEQVELALLGLGSGDGYG